MMMILQKMMDLKSEHSRSTPAAETASSSMRLSAQSNKSRASPNIVTRSRTQSVKQFSKTHSKQRWKLSVLLPLIQGDIKNILLLYRQRMTNVKHLPSKLVFFSVVTPQQRLLTSKSVKLSRMQSVEQLILKTVLEDIIPRNFVKIFQERSVFLYHSR